MVTPELPPGLLATAGQIAGQGQAQRDVQTKHSRLAFAATVSAMQGGCNCQACKLLRAGISALLEEVAKEVPELAADQPSSPATVGPLP
jgi:hypothetical protein